MGWVLDSTHTRVGFSVKHMMVSTVRGAFHSYRGNVQLDPQDFTRSTIEGEVDVASIDTHNEDRDKHLRTGDFFDAETHPKITFKSTSISKKGDDYAVTGDLTIRGVTRPVTFDVEFGGTAKNPWGKTIAGLSASATIDRKDFGVSFHAALETGGLVVADKVKIDLEAEFVLEA